MNELHLTKKDFKLEWFSGTGAGGQHRNKHQNCCRITHIESGMVETGQNSRERSVNQREAFTKLANKVIKYYASDAAREISNERIRSYHEPRNIVTDHASGLTQEYKRVVTEGNMEDMIEARRKEMAEILLEETLKQEE
jgi:protein subunit release factor A